ncbi:MAG: hypothetical protein U0U46_14430 [Saprospiraceae bacterium]
MINEFNQRHDQLKEALQKVIDGFLAEACPCAFPRFRQIAGIDCTDTGDSYCCHDTELLIYMVKPLFDVEPLGPAGEAANEKWVCKTCGSTYHWGWSDFSIHVNRQTLKISDLRAVQIGKEALKPVPLFLGLSGHSYPSRTEMQPATLEEMITYLKKK